MKIGCFALSQPFFAIESGKEVVWDPKTYRITSPEELNTRMSAPVRGDWMKEV